MRGEGRACGRGGTCDEREGHVTRVRGGHMGGGTCDEREGHVTRVRGGHVGGVGHVIFCICKKWGHVTFIIMVGEEEGTNKYLPSFWVSWAHPSRSLAPPLWPHSL